MAELLRISSFPYPNGNRADTIGKFETRIQSLGLELEVVRVASNKNEVERNIFNGSANKSGDIPVVAVRKASKHFKKGFPILHNMNMTVNRGEIYSLLGASGCGKSLILKCIVGVQKLNKGSIFVFGGRPGARKKSVGYMPQETSLYDDFSIAETLSYFGMLYGLDRETIMMETRSLKKLLHLPHITQTVGKLSGGEQRRVSFAVALIANPELLVLDEPTVGVDPLLRERIWSHLVYLATSCGTTVLITTHYIDEARRSNTIGVMRHGRLLVEHNPTSLLKRFNATSLETAILQLCRQDPRDCPAGKGNLALLQHDVTTPDDFEYFDFVPPENIENTEGRISDSVIRVKSLIRKNLIVLSRNSLLSFISVFMPATVIYLMCMAFKYDPKDLNFGVVNYEVPNVHYKNKAEAATEVRKGNIWGYMVFSEDYSSSFLKRFQDAANVNEKVLNESEIIVKMDQTSKNVAIKIIKSLYDGLEEFAKMILNDCGFDQRNGEYVLKYHTPVFGTDDMKFINFLAPGITLAWYFFFPILASSTRYIADKKGGTLERSLLAGTKTWEVMFAYGCTEFLIHIVQSLLIYFILTVAIGIELLGSHILVVVLLFLNGFCGVWMGFLIGAFCNEELIAAMITFALFIPVLCVSGVFWPLEGMPLPLQYVSYAMPCTFTGESLRSLFSRGWPLSHPNVSMGFASIVGWILIYFLLAVLVVKIKK